MEALHRAHAVKVEQVLFRMAGNESTKKGIGNCHTLNKKYLFHQGQGKKWLTRLDYKVFVKSLDFDKDLVVETRQSLFTLPLVQ